jgi:predicted dehydrogenase
VDKVKVGIIGIGNMGSSHAKSIASGEIEGMELAAIADRNPQRLDWAKENLPAGIELFNDAEKMMASGLIDAIIIATPHYDHPPLAIKGFEHGLHVLSEKPAGVYTKQVRQMNEAAQKSDRVFAIMFNQRTNCIYRKMKEIISSGELGQIKRSNWIITSWYRSQSYYDSGSWRATWAGEGGGVLLNQCPHNLDLWQWICGMPSKIQAFCHNGKWHDIEVEDDVTAYAEYPNGATGVFITTTADTPGTNRFEVMLDGGKLVCENDKLTLYKNKVLERQWNATYQGGFGEPGFTTIEVETDGQNPQHAGVLRAFAGAILHGAPLIASGLEGINGLTVSNAMHLSSWLQKPVELPLDEDLFLSELNKRIATSRLKTGADGKVLSVGGTFNA